MSNIYTKDISSVGKSVDIKSTRISTNVSSSIHDVELSAFYDVNSTSKNNINMESDKCINLKTNKKSINLSASKGQINLNSKKNMDLRSIDKINTTSNNDTNITSIFGNVNISSKSGNIELNAPKNINITPGPNNQVAVSGTLNATQIYQGADASGNGGALLIPTGSILPYAGNTNNPPYGWLYCDGSSYDIVDYLLLYNAIGNVFGGTEDTFNVPDLRGRVPIGPVSETFEFGNTGGEAEHILTVDELPSHSHGYTTISGDTARNQNSALLDYTDVYSASSTNMNTSTTGSGQAHNNMQPYIVLNYIIKF